MKFAPHIEKLQPSATLAISQKAQEMKQQGIDVIGLSVGEPDFDTPLNVKAAAINAINANESHYTAVGGTADLKAAIGQYLQRHLKLNYEAKEIIVSTGSKQSLYNALQVLICPGDEVIIPAPYWVSYPPMVQLAQGQSVCIPTSIETGFKITAEQLKAAITPRTKALILNSPNNPTGAIYSEAELSALAEVLRAHPNIWVLSDEVYRYLSFSGNHAPSLLNVAPDLRAQTLIFDSTSKSFCMTGWRIGFAAGNAEVIKAMGKLQSQSTSCPNSIAQAASIEAFTNADEYAKSLIPAYQERHATLKEGMTAIDGFKVLPSAGPFYLFIDCNDYITKKGLENDLALASTLLEQAKVAVVPGSAFGAPGHLRLSFALSNEKLNEAINRIQQACL